MKKSRKLLIVVQGETASVVRSSLFSEPAKTISKDLAISLRFKGLGTLKVSDGLLCVRGNPNYPLTTDVPVRIININQLKYQQAQSAIRESAKELCEKILCSRMDN